MGSDSHRLCSPDLARWANKLGLLLIHGYCLVNVGLHELVLRILRPHLHALVASLARVPNAFYGLGLRLHLNIGLWHTERCIGSREAGRVVHKLLSVLHLTTSATAAFTGVEIELSLLHGSLKSGATRVGAAGSRISGRLAIGRNIHHRVSSTLLSLRLHEHSISIA